MESKSFDIIVVGAGHAGIEAAMAASRLGSKTLLITSNIQRIGYMSCNPSIGGLAKGHMVREIDVLGGQMGLAADKNCIQFKRLNSSRGPAVRGTRMQIDKNLYCDYMSKLVLNTMNLSIIESEVKSLVLVGNNCVGVRLPDSSEINAQAVVLTTGTFMNGVMHVGLTQTPGGRVGDIASVGLSNQLAELGFKVQRLKTGTPARLLRESIDWSKTQAQSGDSNFFPFSFSSPYKTQLPQIECFITRTSEKTHEIIRANLHRSPIYCGIVEGLGPRYCPSIEDKVMRFSERNSHQSFLEPEGLDTNLIYLQGISTSLPEDVQMEFLRTIDGLENVKVARFGYAVEYDFIEPTQIFHSLESRSVSGLFLAGQINGTSGYEEAASQGLVAGINAHNKVVNKEPLILARDQAYIGVLIDDLVTKGTREPYRMFTSRAEHRLVLREDNTIDRLYNVASEVGLHSDDKLRVLDRIKSSRSSLKDHLCNNTITPTTTIQNELRKFGSSVLNKPCKLADLIRRNEINCLVIRELGFLSDFPQDPLVDEAVEIDLKYHGYIQKQLELIELAKRWEAINIPADFDYSSVRGLSTEEKSKLSSIRPINLGQAQRISGVNPSAIQALVIYLKTKFGDNAQMKTSV